MSKIIYNSATNISVQSSTKVKFKNMYEFVKDGKVIATIDGEYDFKNCPPEYTSMILNTIKRNGMKVYMQSGKPIFPKNRMVKEGGDSIFKKLFKRVK